MNRLGERARDSHARSIGGDASRARARLAGKKISAVTRQRAGTERKRREERNTGTVVSRWSRAVALSQTDKRRQRKNTRLKETKRCSSRFHKCASRNALVLSLSRRAALSFLRRRHRYALFFFFSPLSLSLSHTRTHMPRSYKSEDKGELNGRRRWSSPRQQRLLSSSLPR